VTNVNDVAPVISSAATYSAAENQTGIGSVSASDVEGDTLTYSISGSELAISSAGVITFKAAPDFETKTSYTATVTVSDGVNTATKALTISVTNVNDVAPVITSSASSYSLNENSTAAIGTITASDAEGDSFVYSTSGTDSSYFNIGSSSGVLSLKVAPDYETKASYSFNVVASDGVNSGSKAITLSIANLNDNSPLFTTSAAQSLIEGNTAVGNIVASDADGNSVSYTLSGTNSSLASITSGGVLTLNSKADYETKTSYSVIITATDGTNSTTQTVTISVINDTYDDISMPKKIQLAELKKENG
jgi:serralysin